MLLIRKIGEYRLLEVELAVGNEFPFRGFCRELECIADGDYPPYPEFRCDLRIRALQVPVHLVRSEVLLENALVVGPVRPGLVEHDFRLGGILLYVVAETVSPWPVGINQEAVHAVLLDGDIVPFLGLEHLLQSHLPAIVPIRLAFRVAWILLMFHCKLVVLLQGTSADAGMAEDQIASCAPDYFI